jgi:hypothetical protein
MKFELSCHPAQGRSPKMRDTTPRVGTLAFVQLTCPQPELDDDGLARQVECTGDRGFGRSSDVTLMRSVRAVRSRRRDD